MKAPYLLVGGFIMDEFKCPICGNSDLKYTGLRKGKRYCRKCITFRGQEATDGFNQSGSCDYALHYELSPDQKRLSKELVNNFINGIDTLVHAVCGSGKTEIVLEVISYAISNNLKVGFAVPRRDVIRELFLRFKSIFTHNRIVVVYGGHTRFLEGDLICLTTHQLFRYSNYFDLLILDEIDAFPYNGNDVLEALFNKAVKGHYVLLSATPSKQQIEAFSKNEKAILNLNKRFHNHPLPVPSISIHSGIMRYYCLIKEMRRFLAENKPIFVFSPTINTCEQTYEVVKLFFRGVDFVHSKCSDRNERIDKFRKGATRILITTAVLERGVTLKNLQVIVFGADHPLYTSAALIQISGRVGRKKDAPEGEVIFIAKRETNEMVTAIKEIERANKSL